MQNKIGSNLICFALERSKLRSDIEKRLILSMIPTCVYDQECKAQTKMSSFYMWRGINKSAFLEAILLWNVMRWYAQIISHISFIHPILSTTLVDLSQLVQKYMFHFWLKSDCSCNLNRINEYYITQHKMHMTIDFDREVYPPRWSNIIHSINAFRNA